MIAYSIHYRIKGDEKHYDTLVDAKNIQSAKRKIARKHKKKDGTPYKDGRVVNIDRVFVVGYF